MKRFSSVDDDEDFVDRKRPRGKLKLKKTLLGTHECKAEGSIFNNQSSCNFASTNVKLSLQLPQDNSNQSSERCPLCSFPFKHLVGITKNWHATECLEFKFDNLTGLCPDGTECNSISVSHFRTFRHLPHSKTALEVKNTNFNSESNGLMQKTIMSNELNQSSTSNFEEVKIFKSGDIDDVGTTDSILEELCSAEVEMYFSDETGSTSMLTNDLNSCAPSSDNESSNTSSVSKLSSPDSSGFEASGVRYDSIHLDQAIKSTDYSNQLGQEYKIVHNMNAIKKSWSTSLMGCGKKLVQTDIGSFFGLSKKSPSTIEFTSNTSVVTNKEWRWNHRSKNVSKDASIGVAETKPTSDGRSKRQCPFYKKIPSSPFTVDAFRYGEIPGCSCFFLSHFHYDHYGGLTKKFKGKVYCSKVTANLVINQLKVPSANVVALPLNTKIVIQGVTVTLLDANHCPGSVLFLFEFGDGRNILHTGDFRASDQMRNYNEFKGKLINILYLDTTYCLPYYKFPTQEETVNFAVKKALAHVRSQPKTLVVCGTYTIGKEKVFHAVAKALESKICVRRDKLRVLSCLDWEELSGLLTCDRNEAQVHVLPMNSITIKFLQDYLTEQNCFKAVIAFKPTGWTYTDKVLSLDEIKPITRPGITIYGIPYSEHSSYNELEQFVRFIKPKKIIPTVNVGSPAKRDEMQKTFKEWLS